MVQPIIVRQQVRPGRRIPLDVKLENIGGDTTETVSLRLAELTQNTDGSWMEVVTNDPNNKVDVSSLRSCKSWLTVGVESVQLDPYQISPIPVMAQIPGGTQGYYFAALIAQTAPRPTDIEGVMSMMSVQYLVPIVLEVQSRAVPANVKLTGVGLRFKPATLEEPAATVIASLNIENNGGTYSLLQGQIRIWHMARGRWTKIADLTLPDNGIIPGVKLKLEQDVGLLLPDGRYRVDGYLYVDGRRGNGYSEEIDFQGDPTTQTPKILVPIDLDKENIFVDATPGSTRSCAVAVGNGSEERIKVNAEIILPPHMLNVMSPTGISGPDLGCADWVTLQPPEFDLDGYRRRNLNMIIRMPDTATQSSNYYATLRLHVTYPDGTSGGTKIAQLCLRNGRASSRDLISEKTMTFGQLTPSRYAVTAIFRNDGVTHVTPTCRGLLTAQNPVTGEMDAKYKQFLMFSEAEGQRGIFTPFESRTFSGTLDVSDIPAGTYRLTAVVDYPGRNAQSQDPVDNPQSQQIVEVYEENGRMEMKPSGWDKAPDGKRGKVLIRL